MNGGDEKCIKCLETGKAILSTGTSGSCVTLSSICSLNNVFIRTTPTNDNNHIGTC